jgi:hypothetical protein
MPANTQTASTANKRTWIGRIVSILCVLFLLMDSVMKIVKAQPAVEGAVQLGYPESTLVPIGLILLFCTVLYTIPRTAILGAILLTGYLGGAVATQVRVGNPLFTHILFPVYFGVLVWVGLYLRNNPFAAVLFGPPGHFDAHRNFVLNRERQQ